MKKVIGCAYCGGGGVRSGRRFCSRPCRDAGVTVPLAVRWARRVDQSGGPDACWPWTGSRTSTGYGQMAVLGENCPQATHRVAWALANGPIPDGMWVLHRCDTPLCVNPAHLFLGTSQDNIADKLAKGRQARGDTSGPRLHPERMARGAQSGARKHPERMPRGERQGHAKLTEDAVRRIREMADRGERQRVIAQVFGVDPTTIHYVVTRTTWRHVA